MMKYFLPLCYKNEDNFNTSNDLGKLFNSIIFYKFKT